VYPLVRRQVCVVDDDVKGFVGLHVAKGGLYQFALEVFGCGLHLHGVGQKAQIG
jgi:hypothetical protein